MRSRTSARTGLSLLALALFAGTAGAFPVTTVFVDAPTCDPLAGPLNSDELGHAPPFPTDETIVSGFSFVPDPACIATDDPSVPNALVRITNLTGRTFTDLWYVGEDHTFFSNIDGTVNGVNAFKIDTVGFNTPLLSESGIPNGIFEPGESWEFIVQDFSNAIGLAPDGFDSLGVPSTIAGVVKSSASIVAIPTPGAISLLLGAAGLAASRRRR